MKAVPDLNKLLFPAFRTITRKKSFEGSSYSNSDSFVVETLESKKLEAYRNFFELKETLPLSYFYLLSQAVQTSLMVEKSFPLPIPGMVHIETKIRQLAAPSLGIQTEIVAEVHIENKAEGSLLPLFTEHFYQNGIKIIEIESTYLVKRKSKVKSQKKRENSIIEDTESNWLDFNWKLSRNLSWKYARISGDYNPIHISNIFAMFSGFRRKIIHGWYLASRIIAEIEKETDMPARSIEINFLKALTLPSDVIFEFRLSTNRNLEFRIKNSKEDMFYVSGYIS